MPTHQAANPPANIKSLSTRRGLTTPEAASYLGVSEALLRKDRTQREPQIPFSKILGRVVYYVDRLDQYVLKNERGVAA